MSKIKIEIGIKDYNPRKKLSLINTSKIEINGDIGIKYYIALEKPILSITKKMKKEIKEKKNILINLQNKG